MKRRLLLISSTVLDSSYETKFKKAQLILEDEVIISRYSGHHADASFGKMRKTDSDGSGSLQVQPAFIQPTMHKDKNHLKANQATPRHDLVKLLRQQMINDPSLSSFLITRQQS
ncbi:hypothetical protein QCA50_004974 [Cerrena zonata]|uniref:Uncharacterized protein n=1 Tax=Cerrena zonata TaxID=2478898 RepID=A0AAW0GE79_9APHY